MKKIKVMLPNSKEYILRFEKIYENRVVTYITNFVQYHTGVTPLISEFHGEICSTPITKEVAKKWHIEYLEQFSGHNTEKVEKFFNDLEELGYAIKRDQ